MIPRRQRWLLVLGALAAACDLASPRANSSDRNVSAVHAELARAGRARVLARVDPDDGLASSLLRGQLPRAAHELVRRAGAEHVRVERYLPLARTLVLEVDQVGLDALNDSEQLGRIGLDQGGRAHLAQSLPLAGFPAVRSEGHAGAGITVATLDTGVDSSHPDLVGKVIDEACFCGTGCCPGGTSELQGPASAADDHGHGTHVAGSIAGSGTLGPGVEGGAPSTKLIAIKVLDQNAGLCCTSDVAAALEWLLLEHPEVDVVNLSLGSSALFTGHCDSAAPFVEVLATAVDALAANGTLVVASSGNDGDAAAIAAPACVASVVSVGAVWDEDVGPESIYCTEPVTAPDRIACFSNTSPTLDLLAPGARITSSWLLSSYRGQVGTSQAAPLVSACAGLLLEAVPGASPVELGEALRQSRTALTDSRNGLVYPRLDCEAALAALRAARDAGSFEQDAGAEPDGAVATAPDSSVPATAPDAAAAPATDAAPEAGTLVPAPPAPIDAASPRGGDDAGTVPRGTDAGPRARTGEEDCGCRTPGAPGRTPGLWPSLALLALALLRTRRLSASWRSRRAKPGSWSRRREARARDHECREP